VAGDTDFIYKLDNNTAVSFDVDLPLASTLANGNFFSFQVGPTSSDPVEIKPQLPDSLFDLTGGAVASVTLSVIGETAEIITDGTNWFVYNSYEEPEPSAANAVITALPYDTGTPGIVLGDFVYISSSSPTGFLKPSSASSLATMPCIGVMAGPLGGPGLGLVDVLNLGSLSTPNYVVPVAAEAPGTQYIMSTTAGSLVAVNDVTNLAYPSAVGEVIQTIAVLLTTGATNTFFINPDITTLEL